MNEQIQEIMNQARAQYRNQDLPHEQGLIAYSEKFAELLIVKCANIIWNEADMKDSAEINEGGYKILKHFGIDWTTK